MGDAIVVLSGGQDSTTSLFWTKEQFDGDVRAVTFHYGQRHEVELECAAEVASEAFVPHEVLEFDLLHELDGVDSAMLDGGGEISDEGHELDERLPTTFLPGRNLLLLTAAASYGLRYGATNIVTGVSEVDYSGYPDCRAETLDPLEQTLQRGLGVDVIELYTPLINRDKAETWAMADELGVVDLIREKSHTCYRGVRDELHEWGYGCGECPACELRREGYFEWENQHE